MHWTPLAAASGLSTDGHDGVKICYLINIAVKENYSNQCSLLSDMQTIGKLWNMYRDNRMVKIIF